MALLCDLLFACAMTCVAVGGGAIPTALAFVLGGAALLGLAWLLLAGPAHREHAALFLAVLGGVAAAHVVGAGATHGFVAASAALVAAALAVVLRIVASPRALLAGVSLGLGGALGVLAAFTLMLDVVGALPAELDPRPLWSATALFLLVGATRGTLLGSRRTALVAAAGVVAASIVALFAPTRSAPLEPPGRRPFVRAVGLAPAAPASSIVPAVATRASSARPFVPSLERAVARAGRALSPRGLA